AGLGQLIENMYETMYNANGVGLAAPQIGESIRLFIVDASALADEEENQELLDFRKVFINAEMLEEEGEEWKFNEGCLSIPEIREEIDRNPFIRIKYYDKEFNLHEDRFSGIQARIIQHEYDHIEGTLFVDHLNPLKRRLLKRKLTDISKGKIEVDYKMKFPLVKKRTA
ncbi:MAG TPA: peptide deformylase, partial [Flavobacteriales bacterium]|nr:peptide deformylase [Flavobacteriales bacterium]